MPRLYRHRPFRLLEEELYSRLKARKNMRKPTKVVKAKTKKQYSFRNPNDYTSLLATHRHIPITSINSASVRYDFMELVLYLNGKDIGQGDLCRVNGKGNNNKKYLHTSSTRIDDKYRHKGHGIALYVHLIETARKIGCTRLYSDTSLNKFSRKMWSEKLSEYGYKVKVENQNACCSNCGKFHHKCPSRYYIDLKKIKKIKRKKIEK